MPKYTADKLVAAMHQYNGNIAAVARAFGTNRNRIYYYMEKHPTVKRAREEERESMIDNAESALYRNVLAGDNTALIFFLKTQGRGRGYTERIDYHDNGSLDALARIIEQSSKQDDDDEL